MDFQKSLFFVLWMKEASAMEGLIILHTGKTKYNEMKLLATSKGTGCTGVVEE